MPLYFLLESPALVLAEQKLGGRSSNTGSLTTRSTRQYRLGLGSLFQIWARCQKR